MPKRSPEGSLWNQTRRGGVGRAPLILSLGLLACALSYLAQFHIPIFQATMADAVREEASGPVFINEVMTANDGAWPDDRGLYSDWIELVNEGDEPVSLKGWTLKDSSGVQSLFTFPDCALKPGELMLIYASGTERAMPGEPLHAAFRLSASGEALQLADASGAIRSAIVVPSLTDNAVYARDGAGAWAVSLAYTPGLSNEAENHLALLGGLQIARWPVVINEIMPRNATYARDEDGECSDWIELRNLSAEQVSLAGWTISDDPMDLGKWTFPDITLKAGEHLLVYASGKNRTADQYALHTSFALDRSGETIYLANAQGAIADQLSYDSLEADQSLSRDDAGDFSACMQPTPGYGNDAVGVRMTARELADDNAWGLFLNEALASTRIADESRASNDWVELHNASAAAIDLTGWGLSDNPRHARKWQFPAGAVIQPGGYLVVYLSGQDGISETGAYHANFSLAVTEEFELTLSAPDGALVDRLPLPAMYTEVSYGRVRESSNEFAYFPEPTRGQSNAGASYAGRARQVLFSAQGGAVAGDLMTLTLSAEQGATIYYTTDCTAPTRASNAYSGPLTISQNTVVRAIAVSNGMLDSFESTRTYLFHADHELPIVTLTSDPDGLFGEERGMYTNYEQLWTRAAYIEYYGEEGEMILGQGVEISLHGNDARPQAQKVFNVIARMEYGDNRLRAKLFPNREHEEYQSILLSASSEDGTYSRMRDALLSTLAEGTQVMWQDCQPAVLYINGSYWGQYYLRQRVNTHGIAQWNGWDDPDDMDLVAVSTAVMQGSNKTFAGLMEWLSDHSLADAENLAYVESIVDVENYLDYVMLEMYVANSDLANMKRYRSDQGDGRWRWILYDLDWAFYNDSNSYDRWLRSDGVETDNRLFMALMKNEGVKEWFLTTLGERLATNWSSQAILAKIDLWESWIASEIPDTCEKFSLSYSRWLEQVEKLRQYTRTRPGKLMSYIKEYEGFSDADMEKYFAQALSMHPLE